MIIGLLPLIEELIFLIIMFFLPVRWWEKIEFSLIGAIQYTGTLLILFILNHGRFCPTFFLMSFTIVLASLMWVVVAAQKQSVSADRLRAQVLWNKVVVCISLITFSSLDPIILLMSCGIVGLVVTLARVCFMGSVTVESAWQQLNKDVALPFLLSGIALICVHSHVGGWSRLFLMGTLIGGIAVMVNRSSGGLSHDAYTFPGIMLDFLTSSYKIIAGIMTVIALKYFMVEKTALIFIIQILLLVCGSYWIVQLWLAVNNKKIAYDVEYIIATRAGLVVLVFLVAGLPSSQVRIILADLAVVSLLVPLLSLVLFSYSSSHSIILYRASWAIYFMFLMMSLLLLIHVLPANGMEVVQILSWMAIVGLFLLGWRVLGYSPQGASRLSSTIPNLPRYDLYISVTMAITAIIVFLVFFLPGCNAIMTII